MTNESINVLAFGRQLAKFEGHLEYVKHNADERFDPAVGICEAFLVLLRELSNGREPVGAISAAIRVHDEEVHKGEAARKRSYERSCAESEVRRAEEEVSQKVECPLCGAAPGSTCRTTGAASSARGSHRVRFRLARSLNDGAHDELSRDEAP